MINFMKTKVYKSLAIKIMLFGILCVSSCDKNKEISKENINKYKKAEISDEFISNSTVDDGISVIEAKQFNTPSKEIVVNGFIGGLRNPFALNRASFVLGDNRLETCDKKPDDHCPTPWDACCEDRNKIIEGTINIQFIDKNGSVLRGSLYDVHGLKPGIQIQVQGMVDNESTMEAMLVNAKRIIIK